MMQGTTNVLVRRSCGRALKDLSRRREDLATEGARTVMKRGNEAGCRGGLRAANIRERGILQGCGGWG